MASLSLFSLPFSRTLLASWCRRRRAASSLVRDSQHSARRQGKIPSVLLQDAIHQVSARADLHVDAADAGALHEHHLIQRVLHGVLPGLAHRRDAELSGVGIGTDAPRR
eukprot:scaffold1659_cov255-Pinguiococcus_pyrenoidosus.AAC.30